MNKSTRFLKICVLGLIMCVCGVCVGFAQANVAAMPASTQIAVTAPGDAATPGVSDNDCVNQLSQCIVDRLELDISPIAFQNPIWRDIFVGVIIFIATLILAHPLTSLIFYLIKRISNTTKISSLHEAFNTLRMPLVCFFYVLGLHLIAYLFFHETKAGRIIHSVLVEATIIILIWGLVRLSDALIDNIQVYAENKNKSSITGFLHLIKRILRITIIILGITVVLDNLGLKISAFLTALGLGGAALAFASKDVLSNFYGSIAILLDRPFSVGDIVSIAGNSGKVESIGIRSTNIRTVSNTIISIPNSIVANAVIDNQAPQPNTLMTLTLAIAASTPKKVVPEIIDEFKGILEVERDVDPATVQVVFSKIQPYSMEIEVYFGITSKNPIFCRAVKERVNYKLMEALKARSITLAYF